ncbi:hypothetical protein GOQ30_11355 [Flavobacterium sp. TP390]|uniref:Uncharacterized protein n=1 Tax=Flavobacterium profundi TaxID=1774945 RepID=A0A6I4IJ65_9FLAO|nr:hypothetical protein [Flavobacterium profundi]MVO09755.1 hypothetical protein [Flavobacterium profundi]
MYNNQYTYNQEQLNGWLGRALKRLIVKVASFVDSSLNTATFGISSEIGSFSNLAQDIGSGGSSFWQRGTFNEYDEILANLQNDPRGLYEPTFNEEMLLDDFSNDLSLIIQDITNDVLAIENQAFSEAKLEKINAILKRVSLLKEYHKYNELKGLSKPALELRDLLIETMVIPVLKVVSSQMQGQTNYEKKTVKLLISSGGVLTELQPILKRIYNTFEAIVEVYLPKQITIGNNDSNIDTNTGGGSGSSNTNGNTTTPTEKKGYSLVTKIGIGFGVSLIIKKLLK